MPPTTSHALQQHITEFLRHIGLALESAVLPDNTFLPGIEVRHGRLLFDAQRLRYPGDLLHEAGHLALMTRAERQHAGGQVLHGATHPASESLHDNPAVWEVAAIAWSHAAALHLKLDPALVFHEGGYQGRSQALLSMFALGVYPGAARLAELGLTRIRSSTQPNYPAMVQWLRD